MDDQPISTVPMSQRDKLLKKRFAESITQQSDHLDRLGYQLITLELAIPGLYATALKMVQGSKATLDSNSWLFVTFACWFVALGCTLWCLMPQKWKIDENIMKQNPANRTGALGIEDFFNKSAQRKRLWLSISSIIFFAGVCTAAFTVF